MWPVMAAAHLCEAVFRPLGIEPPRHIRGGWSSSKKIARLIFPRRAACSRYSPRVDLDEGTRRTAKWYAEASAL